MSRFALRHKAISSPKRKTSRQQYLFSDLALISPKQEFLQNLRGKDKRYKRYLGSPLRYAGGKSWAVGYVVERIPENIRRLISPFFGGGSIEIAVAKELGIEVLGFEIFDILVNYLENSNCPTGRFIPGITWAKTNERDLQVGQGGIEETLEGRNKINTLKIGNILLL